MLVYELGIYLVVGRNPCTAGTVIMFGLSINRISKKKPLLQGAVALLRFSVIPPKPLTQITSPSTSTKRACSSAL